MSGGTRRTEVPREPERHDEDDTPPDHVRVVPDTGELDGGDVLDGLRCAVAEFFGA